MGASAESSGRRYLFWVEKTVRLAPGPTQCLKVIIGLGALTASGWPGVVKSAVFVVIILSASAILTRLKIRLAL